MEIYFAISALMIAALIWLNYEYRSGISVRQIALCLVAGILWPLAIVVIFLMMLATCARECGEE